MSWLREHDGEVLDDRMGDLTHLEYRACHALRQYLAREANESGIFHKTRANRAVFSTPNGVRKLTQKQLQKFIRLELVLPLETLTDTDLADLGLDRPDGSGWLRPSHWERYNPPRDKTNAARQKRYRDTHSNGVTVPLRNGTSPRARDRGPVPSLSPTSNEVGRDRPAIEAPTEHRDKRRPDPLWDTLVEIMGASAAGIERGKWNKALKSLRESGATPETLLAAAATYRTMPTFAECALTPLALAGNWSTLVGTNGARANGHTESPAALKERIARIDAANSERWSIPVKGMDA